MKKLIVGIALLNSFSVFGDCTFKLNSNNQELTKDQLDTLEVSKGYTYDEKSRNQLVFDIESLDTAQKVFPYVAKGYFLDAIDLGGRIYRFDTKAAIVNGESEVISESSDYFKAFAIKSPHLAQAAVDGDYSYFDNRSKSISRLIEKLNACEQ